MASSSGLCFLLHPFRLLAQVLWLLPSSSSPSGFRLLDIMMSLQCFANLSMCFIHSALFFACAGQLSRLSGTACLRKLTMSASQRFLGRAWARPRGWLECRSGCQIVAMALHFSASFVTRLQAQRHCLLLHVSSHSLCPDCMSCSSVHLAVRLRNSDHGSRTSTSSVSSSASLDECSLEVATSLVLFAFKSILSIRRCTVRSRLCWSILRVQHSQPYRTVEETTALNNFKRSRSRNRLLVSSSLCFVNAPHAAAMRLLNSCSCGS